MKRFILDASDSVARLLSFYADFLRTAALNSVYSFSDIRFTSWGFNLFLKPEKKMGKPSVEVVVRNCSLINTQLKGNRGFSQSRLIPKELLPKIKTLLRAGGPGLV